MTENENNISKNGLIWQTPKDLLGDSNDKVSQVDIIPGIEAILFANGEPISLDKISDILNLSKDETQELMDGLINRYKDDINRGIYIRKIENSYCFSTKPNMKNILERLFVPRNRPPLSQAAYETLAIIAYNQPVTRTQVESVRGVSSDSIVSRLVEKNLIQECGNLDAPGRPTLFETTETFLKEFGLNSVDDLPPMDMMMYGTLRDIENSVSQNEDRKSDNQITIDQFVDTIIPKESSEDKELNKLENDELIDISNALFGSDDSEKE